MDGSLGSIGHRPRKPRTTHVVRVSELDYFLEISRYATDRGKLTKKTIFEILTEKRIDLEKKRPITSSKRFGLPTLEGKIKRGYLTEGAIKDTVKLCLDWNILTPSATEKDVYLPTKDCIEIGEFVQKNEINNAQLKLLDVIIKSGMDRLFDPQNFLLNMRNSVLESVTPYITVSKKEEILGKVKREKKIIPLSSITVPREEGIAYNDYRFTFDVMHTNPVSLSVILDWGSFFKLVNFFSPQFDVKTMVRQVKDKLEITPDKGWKITGTYPTKGAYLCKIIVSFAELAKLITFLTASGKTRERKALREKLKLTSYVETCLIYTAQKLGLISVEGDIIKVNKHIVNFHQLLDLALKSDCLILSDGENVRGIIKSSEEDLDPRTTYIITEPEWALETFLRALWVHYYELVEGKTFLYAPIPRIRERVCRDLRIHDDAFDEYLNKCRLAFSNFVSLSLGSAEIKSRLKIKKFEKAFMLHGRSYYLIKVKRYPG